MSETTTKLRAFQTYSVGACGVRDLAADAIEAVEAQVAEAVARVEKLEKRTVAQIPQERPACTGEDAGTARGGTGAAARSVPNAEGSPAGSTSPPAPSAVTAPELRHRATQGFVSCAPPSDMWPHEPPSSAFAAPRGFRVGDRVRITNAHTCSSEWIGCEGRIVAPAGGFLGDWTIGDLTKFAHLKTVPMYSQALTLVRAADAPEAPAEEDTGLVVQRIRDEATKPLHVEIEKLRGEVARLTKERDKARKFHELAEGDLRKWIDRCNERDKDVSDLRAKYLTLEARAEAADIRADGHAEGLRSIRKMLKQSPPDVDRAILWCDDSLSGYTQSVAATEAETNDRALAAEARAETAEKELAEARAISAATAERVRNETQIATELRKDLADARDRIASKDRSIEVMLAETRALREALDAERSGVATKLHDAGFNNVENLVGAYRFERAQADALRFSARTWFNEKGEPELLATAEEVTERRKAAAKELAALKSKPRFRTRKVTKADVEDFIAHDGCFYESLRALGFRRRVDGAK